jgi:hypothetical protein
MATFRLQGVLGKLGIGVLVAVLAVRLFSLDEIDDPQLRTLLVQDIEGGVRNRLISASGAGSSAMEGEIARRSASTAVELLPVHGSAPLFSFSATEKMVLKVRYRVRDDEGTKREEARYYRVSYTRLSDRWQLRSGNASIVSYYLNFF